MTCSCEGVSLCSLCELSGSRGRVGSEVSMDGAFPWGALSAVTFVGGKHGDGEVQPGPLVNLGLMANLPLWRQAQLSGCWSKSRLGWIPLTVCFLLTAALPPLRRASQSWQAWFRPRFRLCCMLRRSQQAGQSPRQFPVCCLQDHLQPNLPSPFSETFTLCMVELTLPPLCVFRKQQRCPSMVQQQGRRDCSGPPLQAGLQGRTV